MGSSHEQAGNLQHEPLRLVGDISDDWIWSFSILVGWHQARSAETTFCLSQNKAPFFAGEQGSRWTSLLWKSRCQRCPHIPFHDLAIPIFSSAGWPISTEVFKSWLFRMPVWLEVSYDVNHLTYRLDDRMLIFGHSAVTEYLLDLAQCQPRRNGLALVAKKKGAERSIFWTSGCSSSWSWEKKGIWSLGNGGFFLLDRRLKQRVASETGWELQPSQVGQGFWWRVVLHVCWFGSWIV